MEKKINFETKINLKAKKEIILIFFTIFLIGFVYAVGLPPPLPDHFIGNVTIDGQNAPIGTQISIYVNSTLKPIYSISEAGKYDLYITTGEFNDSVIFKIQDRLAGNATRQGGKTIYRDLSITTTSSGDSGGSSGGGGGGGGGGGSSGSSAGIISPSSTTNESASGSEDDTTQTSKTIGQKSSTTGITGAVIDFLGSGEGMIIVLVILILGIGVMLIKFKAPKWKRKFS